MLASLLSFCLSFLRTTTQVRLGNLFLRKQLEIAVRSSPKLKFKPTDRFFLGLLTDLLDSWKGPTWIVKPDTVIRWHRESFRVFWKWRSRSRFDESTHGPREIHVTAVENVTRRTETVRATLFVRRQISSAHFTTALNNALNS